MLPQLRQSLRVCARRPSASQWTSSRMSLARCWSTTSSSATPSPPVAQAEVVAETNWMGSPPVPSRRLLFKNVPANADYMQLAFKMQEIGALSNFFIQVENGTGLVEYVAAEDAKRAVELLHQLEFEGNVLSVFETELTKEELQAQLHVAPEHEQPDDPDAFKRTLAVDNLASISCYASFRNHIQAVTGAYEAVWMHTSGKDLTTNETSICAFVRYASQDAAAKALETLQAQQFMNQDLSVRAATEKEFKQQQQQQ